MLYSTPDAGHLGLSSWPHCGCTGSENGHYPMNMCFTESPVLSSQDSAWGAGPLGSEASWLGAQIQDYLQWVLGTIPCLTRPPAPANSFPCPPGAPFPPLHFKSLPVIAFIRKNIFMAVVCVRGGKAGKPGFCSGEKLGCWVGGRLVTFPALMVHAVTPTPQTQPDSQDGPTLGLS